MRGFFNFKKIFILLLILIVLYFFFKLFIFKKESKSLKKNELILSSIFEDNFIPQKYTCDGQDINPPIFIKNLPEDTKTIVIIVEDIDAPSGVFVHWLAWNIPPIKEIPEGYQPPNEGINDFGKINYGGPCPPPGKEHRYFFRVYALNSILNLPSGSKKEELLPLLKGKILKSGEIYGIYKK